MSQSSTSVVAAGLPKIAYGRGLRVYDTQGREYLDASGGPAVFCLGHGHPEVNAVIQRQLEHIAHGYRYTFTSEPLEQLTTLVQRGCGADLTHIVFVSGGSEAVESCLKLALQYHSARGDITRRRFIARRRSWHGNTLGALSLSDYRERREPFEGALLDVIRIGAVNAYRPPTGVTADQVAEHCATELEQAIMDHGPETIAAFVFEPVVGSAGGVVPAPPSYAARVRDICNRYGVLMVADEVMSGVGRCGTWRALAHDDVVPDIMAVAKGLAGGYMPLGAAIYSQRVAEPIHSVHGGALTGHTFTGHTAACAAGVAVQQIIERDGLLPLVTQRGEWLKAQLRDVFSDEPAVGDVRGRGYFIGIELVADPATKTPFPAEQRLYLKIRDQALAQGLICYPNSGHVDGRCGDTVILAPPYNSTTAELTEIVARFQVSVSAALAQIER